MTVEGNSKALELKWQPLKSYRDLPKIGNIRGVYVWGFHIDEKFKPYYVGKAKDIKDRIFKHLGYILGGLYNIFHENSLSEFQKFKQDVPNEKASCGLLYVPTTNSLPRFIESDFLKGQAGRMVDHFRFTVAAVPKEVETWKVESAVIKALDIKNLINTTCRVTPLIVRHSSKFDQADGISCNWILEYL
ncbi:MAG: GIY-YIG nuclease family protein [Pseudomonadota bacterium]